MQFEKYAQHGDDLLAVLKDAFARADVGKDSEPGEREPFHVTHSGDGAWLVTWTDGRIVQHGETVFRHRLGGPARVSYERDGELSLEWCQSGVFHRDDGGPAILEFNADGDIVGEEWWEHGRFIRRRCTTYDN